MSTQRRGACRRGRWSKGVAAAIFLVIIGVGSWAVAGTAFVLSGVVLVPDQASMAWLQEPTETGDQVVVVREGDRLGAYRVTRIQADQVDLDGPGGRVVVPLYSRLTTQPVPGASARSDRLVPAVSPPPASSAGGVAPATDPAAGPAAVEAFKQGLLGALTGGRGPAPEPAPEPGVAPAPAPAMRGAGRPAERLKRLFGGQ